MWKIVQNYFLMVTYVILKDWSCNQISLAGTHTVELEQRENEQTRQRQLSDKAGREQVEVT